MNNIQKDNMSEEKVISSNPKKKKKKGELGRRTLAVVKHWGIPLRPDTPKKIMRDNFLHH